MTSPFHRTKIVCTLGPCCDTLEKIEGMIDKGMNVARLNFSHGTHEEHGNVISLLKEARRKKQVPLAIMLDTKGPEIRLGKLKEEKVYLVEGSSLWLLREEVEGSGQEITLTPAMVLDVLKKDMVVLLDDGLIFTHVVEVDKKGVRVQIDYGGIIRSTKGVNIPDAVIDFPPMTEKDIEDIRFGCEQDVDYIAASFIRSSEHVVVIKKLLEEEGKSSIHVIAKIENKEGVKNFDSIVQVADGIMVARGDLGVEMPLTQVPKLQKMMIRKCYLGAKPCVTATQMLESMILNPRPTRAEASDVANAIYDSTSAVMLSGETAIGNYPLETISVMDSIIRETEEDFAYLEFFKERSQPVYYDVPSSVAQASVHTAYSTDAKAIFAFTTSGTTARLLARLRPKMPILAMTPNKKVYNQLSLSWGVIPILSDESKNVEEAKEAITQYALEQGIVKHGDLVVITAGTTFGEVGTTDMMMVDSIGNVLVRGSHGGGDWVEGEITILPSHEQDPATIEGKILLLNTCSSDYLPLLEKAKGVVLQNHVDDTESEEYLKKTAATLSFPYLLRAEGASDILQEGQRILLDPPAAVIYHQSST
ncbi:MAG: Pyruvate kinase [Chlamydiae bacterium]|nr:Pyruvate kinase [Chlamydiota bacterium]